MQPNGQTIAMNCADYFGFCVSDGATVIRKEKSAFPDHDKPIMISIS
jgi:hypothetical protein